MTVRRRSTDRSSRGLRPGHAGRGLSLRGGDGETGLLERLALLSLLVVRLGLVLLGRPHEHVRVPFEPAMPDHIVERASLGWIRGEHHVQQITSDRSDPLGVGQIGADDVLRDGQRCFSPLDAPCRAG